MTTHTRLSKVYTREELCLMEPQADPCAIVIFGASGDLAHRKLFPSLFHLAKTDVLPPSCYIVGTGRTPLSDTTFRESILKAFTATNTHGRDVPSQADLQGFLKRCTYISGDYGDLGFYKKIDAHLSAQDAEHGTPAHRLFYLATPPSQYEAVARRLAEAGMARPKKKDVWVRLVVEKPYGHDLSSAMALSDSLRAEFKEDQIYRIDHYLGKESVQNILMFRFANAIYEPVWNRKYIDHIEITSAESGGVGHRAGYYENAGVLRDMFQNHLFQLLSLVAMEPPSSFEPEALRNEKAQVIQALKPVAEQDIASLAVRGQYEGYRAERGVDARSSTETFAAMRVEIDNWRWQGVPFYLRSGKRLKQSVTEICVEFKHVPTSIFKPLMAEQLQSNVLRFRLQPDEAISLQFEAKHPGPKLCMSTVDMEFNYQEAFKTPPPEAYARLFLDVMLGDPTLFARKDWLHCSWNYLDPILNLWKGQKEKGLSLYSPSTWGPSESDALIRRDSREWLTPANPSL